MEALLCRELAKHFVLLFGFILEAGLGVVYEPGLSVTRDKVGQVQMGMVGSMWGCSEPWRRTPEIRASAGTWGPENNSGSPSAHTPSLLPLHTHFLLFYMESSSHTKKATLVSMMRFLQRSTKRKFWRKTLNCPTCIWGSVLGHSLWPVGWPI